MFSVLPTWEKLKTQQLLAILGLFDEDSGRGTHYYLDQGRSQTSEQDEASFERRRHEPQEEAGRVHPR